MKTKKVAKPAATSYSRRKHELKKAHKKALKQARPLHKKILLHPVTVFFLLCSVVLIAGLTYQVLADSYTVTGKVPAPPLTQGSDITQPSDGATYNVNQVGLNTHPVGRHPRFPSDFAWPQTDERLLAAPQRAAPR